jgi:N-acetylmuramoyl-L-alanine amidase
MPPAERGRPLLSRGDAGPAVAEVRTRLAQLGLCPDTGSDVFDDPLDTAVRTFQQERGIIVDGVVGPQTFRRLEEARWNLGDRILSFIPGHLMTGDDVTELQRRLNQLGFAAGRPDGMFGPLTDQALREFQSSVGVTADGTCGPDTFRAFDRLVRTVSGGNAHRLREHITLADLQSGIADKVVFLDAGDTVDAAVCHAIAVRVEGRLAALGTQVVLSHAGVDPGPDDRSRAMFANDVGADLVVSIHVESAPTAAPEGLATFYFGDERGGIHSTAGRILADLVQQEVQSRTDLLDCRTHPRAWDLLRLTRMPAVRVFAGYVSNPDDRRRLTNPAFQDAVSHGVAAALTRFCAPRP